VPIILFFAFVFIAICAAIVLAPLGLIQRYRAGRRRRRARRWVAGVNIAGYLLSVVLFLGGALITNHWVPDAFGYALAGLAAGCLLGVAGLALTTWEEKSGELSYTPNRLLVLSLTLLIAGRLAYGLWRMWHARTLWGTDQGWLEHSGIQGTLAASAIILGYSLTYWIGLFRKIQQLGSRPD
jgi:hypothetical protein